MTIIVCVRNKFSFKMHNNTLDMLYISIRLCINISPKAHTNSLISCNTTLHTFLKLVKRKKTDKKKKTAKLFSMIHGI